MVNAHQDVAIQMLTIALGAIQMVNVAHVITGTIKDPVLVAIPNMLIIALSAN